MSLLIDWNARFTPPTKQTEKPKYEFALEGLRGLAALSVISQHLTLGKPAHLDFGYQLNSIFTHFNAARDSVLIFFLLSGYVIGLTNIEPFSKPGTILYLIRRGVRLLPIYFFAVLLSFFASQSDSLGTFFSNLFFLQNLTSPPLAANTALWTLNYEVVYYLAFPVVLYFRPKIALLLLGSFSITCLGWFVHPFPQIISGYFAGWLFWLIGLWLSWKVPPRNSQLSIPLISCILLFMATGEFHLGAVLLGVFKLGNPNPNFVSLQDLTTLPICAVLVAIIANRSSKIISWLFIISFAVPIISVVYALVFKGGFKTESWAIGAIELIVAITLLWLRTKPDILRHIAFLGSISYGIYVLHMPLILIVRNYFPSSISGSLVSFLLRLSIWFSLTVLLAYLLEIKIQPLIKNWFQKNVLVNFKAS